MDVVDMITSYKEIKILIKFHQEFEQFYEDVFIPEYQTNSVFTEPYIDKNGVFKLILKKVISDYTEYLYDEDDIFGEDDEVKSGIISINQLPSFSKLVEFEKRVPDWIHGLYDYDIYSIMLLLESDEVKKWKNTQSGDPTEWVFVFWGVSAFDHFDCFIETRSSNTIIPKVETPKVKANTVNALSWEPHKTFTNHPATNPSKKLTGITIIHAHQINHFGFIRISIRCFSQ